MYGMCPTSDLLRYTIQSTTNLTNDYLRLSFRATWLLDIEH